MKISVIKPNGESHRVKREWIGPLLNLNGLHPPVYRGYRRKNV